MVYSERNIAKATVYKEILYGTGQDSKDRLIFSLDQLTSASISVDAEEQTVTDKKGNEVRTTYRNKTGEFTSTSALLHPAVMNVQSGSDITYATSNAPIVMPKIHVVEAGKRIAIPDIKTGTLRVIGIFGNGANDIGMDAAASAALVEGTGSNAVFTAPAPGDGLPTSYLIRYERDAVSGAMLTNSTKDFPSQLKLTLFCSYGDPCENDLKPCYVVIPRFAPSPTMEISLDAESQEIDFSGKMNIDYCAGSQALYYIYYPEEDLVVSGVVVEP